MMMMTFEVNDIDYGWSEGGETKQQRFGLILCDAHHPPCGCDDVDVGVDDHNHDHDDHYDRDAMISSRVTTMFILMIMVRKVILTDMCCLYEHYQYLTKVPKMTDIGLLYSHHDYNHPVKKRPVSLYTLYIITDYS